jgi:methylaspartate mutase epsilon subunit
VNRQRHQRGDCVITLGGIGGDAHSVGLIILRRFLDRSGYRVRYLATQNSPVVLCEQARSTDAVLVSNMDGHAAHYLQDLPTLREELDVGDALWYLGGNPSLTGDASQLLALGFHRVFLGYIEPKQVVAILDADLGVGPGPVEPVADPKHLVGGPGHRRWTAGRQWWPVGVVADESAPNADPLVTPTATPTDEREEVLAQWSTGAGAADLADNAAFLATGRQLSEVQRDAVEQGRILIHPRCGVADLAEQREIFSALRDAGADVLSFQVDSLTRNNAHHDVEMVLKRGADGRDGMTALNGFPLVNHGVAAVRALTEAFKDVPLQVRHSTRDPRLLAEITFAGGVAAFEGGALTYNLPYYRDYPPALSLRRWRYVDRLAAEYYRRSGVVIDREFFGVLTASLVPPCVAIAVNMLEALLAAEEGVRSVSLGYAEQGNRAQDVAAIRVMSQVGRRVLDEYDHHGVVVHTVFHQYMGAFPSDAEKARQLLEASAVTAALSGATRLMLKTCVESRRIPSAADNVTSIGLVRAALRGVDGSEVDWAAVGEEEQLLRQETSAILDAVIHSGSDDLGDAVVRGVAQGYLDVPFAPSLWNAGRALPVRDASGAVRLADPGGLPLPRHVLERHRQLVAGRGAAVDGQIEQLIEYDVLRVARGEYDQWPLG